MWGPEDSRPWPSLRGRRALGDAIERLEADERSSTDFVPTMSVINMLIEEGALVPPDADRGPTSGWADPVEHARMLHDDRRTGDYLVGALRKRSRTAGDVVLDVGTGSGVLAIAAARAGARRVYAVEASDIAEVGERVFTAIAGLPASRNLDMSPEHGDGLGPAAGTEQSHLPLLAGRLRASRNPCRELRRAGRPRRSLRPRSRRPAMPAVRSPRGGRRQSR